MASTFSQNLRLELIASGSQTGVWGNTTNNNLGDLIEQAISGATDLNVTSGDITLTALNGVVDQARSAVLSVTGAAGVTRTVTIPNVSKTYTVKNRSDATVNLKTASGTAFEIPTLSEAYVYCDGDDVITGRFITDGAQNTLLDTQTPFNDVALTGTPTAPTASFGTDTTQLATTEFVQAALQAVFPVGSVYINATATTNPATLFGFGTWTAIGAGQVLVGQDTDDALFETLGDTGGSKDATLVSHSHTGSGTTATTNIDHTHSFSGTTANAGSHSHSGGTNTASLVGDFWVGGDNAGTSGIVSQIAIGGRPGLDNASGQQVLYRVNASHSHSLSINTAGEHNHTVTGTVGNTNPSHAHTFSFTTNTQGSSATNANIQPYLTVKMWKRTA